MTDKDLIEAVVLEMKKREKESREQKRLALANELIYYKHIITFTDTKEMYYWKKETGLYEPAETMIESSIQSILNENASTFEKNETMAMIQRKTFIERESTIDPYLIPMKNGILDIKNAKLLEYSPENYFFSKHNVIFNPNANGEKTSLFLQQITKDENDLTLLKQMIGYCFIRHHKFQVMWLLVGTGANGKSVLLNLLTEMLGEECVSHKALQMLTNYFFSQAGLRNKNANIFFDLSSKAFADTGILKALTGNDKIEAEVKHKGSIIFRSHAKMIASCNEIPMTPDESDGFFRRQIIINFPNKFEGTNENPNLLQELNIEEEKSALFNTAINEFLQAEKKGYLNYNKTTEEKRKTYLNYSNSVKVFCEGELELDSNGEIEKNVIYTTYQNYCKAQKIPEKPLVWFWREFYKLWGGNARQSRKEGIMKVLGLNWKREGL